MAEYLIALWTVVMICQGISDILKGRYIEKEYKNYEYLQSGFLIIVIYMYSSKSEIVFWPIGGLSIIILFINIRRLLNKFKRS